MIFTLALFMIQGSSMMHMNYNDGDTIETVYGPCPAQSVIAFEYEDERYIKFLDHYTGRGDIWVEGRPDIWLKNDKFVESYDSTVYGYIPTDKYNIIGCVK